MTHESHKELINTLSECISATLHCSVSCSEEKDAQELSRCIKLDNDCTQICSLAISYLCRSSENADPVLQQCAKICEMCAEECEKHSDLEHCKRCAEACRKCAEACYHIA